MSLLSPDPLGDPLTARSSTLHLAVHDADGLWPLVEQEFYARMPIPRSEWMVPSSTKLFVLPALTLAPLPANHPAFAFPGLPVNWYRAPYAHVLLVKCETSDEYRRRGGVRDVVRAFVDDMGSIGAEWVVVYVPQGSQAGTLGTVGSALATALARVSHHKVAIEAGCSLSSRSYRSMFESLKADCGGRRHGGRFVRLDHNEVARRTRNGRIDQLGWRQAVAPHDSDPSIAAQVEGEAGGPPVAGSAGGEAAPSEAAAAPPARRSLTLRLKLGTARSSGPVLRIGGGANTVSSSTAASAAAPLPPLSEADVAAVEEQWEGFLAVLSRCAMDGLTARVRAYDEEIRIRWEQRYVPGWSYGQFFCVKEALAFVYAQVKLPGEALHIYDELEQTFLLIASVPHAYTSAASRQQQQQQAGAARASSQQQLLQRPGSPPLRAPLSSSGGGGGASHVRLGSGSAGAAAAANTYLSCARTVPGIPDTPLLMLAAPGDHGGDVSVRNSSGGSGGFGFSGSGNGGQPASSGSPPSPFLQQRWRELLPLTVAHPPPHLFDVSGAPYRQLLYAARLGLFDFRRYLFARQASLLLSMKRSQEVADRGSAFLRLATDLTRLHVSLGRLHACAARAWLFCATMDVVEVCTRRRVQHATTTMAVAAAPVAAAASASADRAGGVGVVAASLVPSFSVSPPKAFLGSFSAGSEPVLPSTAPRTARRGSNPAAVPTPFSTDTFGGGAAPYAAVPAIAAESAVHSSVYSDSAAFDGGNDDQRGSSSVIHIDTSTVAPSAAAATAGDSMEEDGDALVRAGTGADIVVPAGEEGVDVDEGTIHARSPSRTDTGAGAGPPSFSTTPATPFRRSTSTATALSAAVLASAGQSPSQLRKQQLQRQATSGGWSGAPSPHAALKRHTPSAGGAASAAALFSTASGGGGGDAALEGAAAVEGGGDGAGVRFPRRGSLDGDLDICDEDGGGSLESASIRSVSPLPRGGGGGGGGVEEEDAVVDSSALDVTLDLSSTASQGGEEGDLDAPSASPDAASTVLSASAAEFSPSATPGQRNISSGADGDGDGEGRYGSPAAAAAAAAAAEAAAEADAEEEQRDDANEDVAVPKETYVLSMEARMRRRHRIS